MKLDPRRLRAASLWAEAQYAHSIRQWETARPRYAQVLALYDDMKNISAAYTTLVRLCDVTNQQEDWAAMAAYAKRLLEHDQQDFFIGQGRSARSWFLVGQAERCCQHTEAARYALVESIRMTSSWIEDGFVELETQSDDEKIYIQTRLQPDIALLHADALHEWSLLEAAIGNAQAAAALMALSQLIRDQMIDSV
jgi:hypothetical protein